MENDNTVLLNPPLFALDKDAPLHYAGNTNCNKKHGRALSWREHFWCEACGKIGQIICSSSRTEIISLGQIGNDVTLILWTDWCCSSEASLRFIYVSLRTWTFTSKHECSFFTSRCQTAAISSHISQQTVPILKAMHSVTESTIFRPS